MRNQNQQRQVTKRSLTSQKHKRNKYVKFESFFVRLAFESNIKCRTNRWCCWGGRKGGKWRGERKPKRKEHVFFLSEFCMLVTCENMMLSAFHAFNPGVPVEVWGSRNSLVMHPHVEFVIMEAVRLPKEY